MSLSIGFLTGLSFLGLLWAAYQIRMSSKLKRFSTLLNGLIFIAFTIGFISILDVVLNGTFASGEILNGDIFIFSFLMSSIFSLVLFGKKFTPDKE